MDRREFYQTLLGVVGVYDRAEVDALFDRFDPDGSGYLSYRLAHPSPNPDPNPNPNPKP